MGHKVDINLKHDLAPKIVNAYDGRALLRMGQTTPDGWNVDLTWYIVEQDRSIHQIIGPWIDEGSEGVEVVINGVVYTASAPAVLLEEIPAQNKVMEREAAIGEVYDYLCNMNQAGGVVGNAAARAMGILQQGGF